MTSDIKAGALMEQKSQMEKDVSDSRLRKQFQFQKQFNLEQMET